MNKYKNIWLQSIDYLLLPTSKNIFLMMLLGGIIVFQLMVLIPPFQSPDEQDHLKRAYLLSKGRVLMETPEGSATGGFINNGFNEYASIFLSIAGKPHEKLTDEMWDTAKQVKWSSSESFNAAPGVSYYVPFIYSPQAVGLAMGRLLDLSVHHSYFLARILSVGSIFLLLWASFKIRSPSPLTIALLLMPLTLFQMVATSQDGIALALVVFCLSVFLKLMENCNKEVPQQLYVAFTAALLLLVTSRINLFPMLLLPFLLFYKYKYRYMLFWSVALIFCALGWVFYAMITTVDSRVSIGATSSELLIYYLKHPFQYLSLVYASLGHHQLGGFYVASFVGILGWLDAGIPDFIKNAYCVLLGALLVLTISFRNSEVAAYGRIALLIVAISSFLLVFLLLLITWTPHPAELILGVQGRYFWASALIFSMAATATLSDLGRPARIVSWVLLCILAILSLTSITSTTLQRYYLSSPGAQLSSVASTESYVHQEGFIGAGPVPENAPAGGFVDHLRVDRNEVTIVGWGFFSQNEKEFYSNKSNAYEIIYKTIPRPDVHKATKDEKLIVAGFEIKIPLDGLSAADKDFKDFCLYTKDSLFGNHRLQAGSRESGYECGSN